MTDDNSFFPWLEVNQRLVVDEMIHNQNSKYWEECNKFVERCIHAKTKNIPNSIQEEIIQEAMYKVTRYLPYFRLECALKTWLNKIIESCIIDMHRSRQNEERFYLSSASQLHESDRDGQPSNISKEKSAEDTFMTIEEIRKGWAALLEYARTHPNADRNHFIIQMVIIGGKTHVETTKAVGCSAPVVGYVIREAQRHARQKTGKTPLSDRKEPTEL